MFFFLVVLNALELFNVDPDMGLGVNPTFFEISQYLITYFGFAGGLISLFFPIGLIITLYKLTFTFKNSNAFKTTKKKNIKLNNSHHEFIDKYYYLLLFMIPFLFMSVTHQYAMTIFLPIIIIFSVQGLIYIKKFISKISKKLDWVFPILLLLLVVGYYLLRIGIYPKIVFWDVFLFLLVSLILFLFVFFNYEL